MRSPVVKRQILPRSGFFPFFSAVVQAERRAPLATCSVFISVYGCTNVAAAHLYGRIPFARGFCMCWPPGSRLHTDIRPVHQESSACGPDGIRALSPHPFSDLRGQGLVQGLKEPVCPVVPARYAPLRPRRQESCDCWACSAGRPRGFVSPAGASAASAARNGMEPSSRVMRAHTRRAVWFATATAALLFPRRCGNDRSPRPLGVGCPVACRTTARAPSSVFAAPGIAHRRHEGGRSQRAAPGDLRELPPQGGVRKDVFDARLVCGPGRVQRP
jgi:hypothetical protein